VRVTRARPASAGWRNVASYAAAPLFSLPLLISVQFFLFYPEARKKRAKSASQVHADVLLETYLEFLYI
jgi:hypothetical protein